MGQGIMDQIIRSDTIRVGADGNGEFDIRIPWYRSLALSTIEKVAVSIDDQEIDPAHVRLEVNGVARAIPELAELWQESWFVQDAGTVHVAALAPTGPEAKVHVDMSVRIPYIIIGPETALRRNAAQTRALKVVEAE